MEWRSVSCATPVLYQIFDDNHNEQYAELDGKTILIESTLSAYSEGRMNFTIAHETSHHILQMLSPEAVMEAETKHQLRAAAYCRVSTDDEEQLTSYEAQKTYYTDLIMKNPKWTMAAIFADEGITGTSARKRPDFLRMIRWCKQGKIDLILVKSISRFARNTVDCLNYIRVLKEPCFSMP